MSETIDPYSPENIGTVQFIVMARLYDVMMALLREANPDAARDLLELHQAGVLVGGGPWFGGTFLSDVMNSQSDVINDSGSDVMNNTDETQEPPQ